jgi:CHAT domain-containing protein
VAKVLRKDSALIEFVAYSDSPLVSKPGSPHSEDPSELRYLALLLFSDGRTHALDLGPAAPIDRAAREFHDVLARRSASYQPAAHALYELAFRPLVPLLGEVQHLFLSPDGQLSLVPFSALHDGRHFLVDSLNITYLTSGKDLLPRPEDIPLAHSVVVLADPDFGSPPSVPSPSTEAPPALTQRSASLEYFFSTLRAEVADQPWPPLPGSRKEAEAIQRLLPHAQLLLGPAATKEALLTLPTPGVLHIATHGFFLEDGPTPPASRAVGSFGAVGDPGPRRSPDPLLRSGLVLAGARAPAPRPDSHSREDSLVTALELAGLDLWGTQLVVLSACDTGRGDAKLGQGVQGLRRSLVVAGAETLVTGLWKVNDETTYHLMESYYRHLLAGLSRTAALHEAMRHLRQKQPHPHFWAPFIAIGQDSPLRELAPHTGARAGDGASASTY